MRRLFGCDRSRSHARQTPRSRAVDGCPPPRSSQYHEQRSDIRNRSDRRRGFHRVSTGARSQVLDTSRPGPIRSYCTDAVPKYGTTGGGDANPAGPAGVSHAVDSIRPHRGVPRGPGCGGRVRPVWTHEHLPARRPRAGRGPSLRHDTARAGRRTRRRRLRASVRQAWRRAPPCRTGHDQRRDWRRDSILRLHPAPRHRRRCPLLLRRPGATSGSQPPSRRRPGLDLRALRQACVARPSCRSAAQDDGACLGSRRCRRPGPVLVSIPMDILGEALDAPIWPASPVERPALSTATASAIATELRIAQRPLLLVGGGTRRASPRSLDWPKPSVCLSHTHSWVRACCHRTIPSSLASSGSGGRRPPTAWQPRPM